MLRPFADTVRLIVVAGPLMAGVLIAEAQTAPPPSDLDRLTGWMSGSFSSAAQAAADTSYFDIHLRMTPVWTERADGRWFYVEQAMATMLDRPYRQRVYQVHQLSPELFESRVYKLPGEKRWIGSTGDGAAWSSLTPDSLLLRDGCSIVLRKTRAGSFAGSTIGLDCESDLRGAAYATSEVSITKEGIVSWDRGFSASGAQVWGAERGGYQFVRVSR